MDKKTAQAINTAKHHLLVADKVFDYDALSSYRHILLALLALSELNGITEKEKEQPLTDQ